MNKDSAKKCRYSADTVPDFAYDTSPEFDELYEIAFPDDPYIEIDANPNAASSSVGLDLAALRPSVPASSTGSNLFALAAIEVAEFEDIEDDVFASALAVALNTSSDTHMAEAHDQPPGSGVSEWLLEGAGLLRFIGSACYPVRLKYEI